MGQQFLNTLGLHLRALQDPWTNEPAYAMTRPRCLQRGGHPLGGGQVCWWLGLRLGLTAGDWVWGVCTLQRNGQLLVGGKSWEVGGHGWPRPNPKLFLVGPSADRAHDGPNQTAKNDHK